MLPAPAFTFSRIGIGGSDNFIMTIDFTRGRLAPSLVRFALPFLFSNILQALYGAVDLFIIGQFCGPAAVSAVSIGSQVMHTITNAMIALAVGGTVLIGNAVGARDHEQAAQAVGNTVSLFSLVAVVATPLFLIVINGFVSMMNTPVEAVPDTRQYLFLCICGLPFIVAYNIVSSIFQGLGDSKTPVYFVIVACGVNVVLDYLLIGSFSMGVRGAAVATVISQGCSALCTLIFLLRRGFPFPFSLPHFRLRRHTASRILQVGAPLCIQRTLVSMSFLIITASINSLGLVASAAVGIVEKVNAFAFLPQNAISSALTGAVAQNIGAQQPKRALRVLRCGIILALCTSSLMCLCLHLWPQAFLSLFSSDAEVLAAAAEYIQTYSLDCVVVSSVFCINSYFNGCGKTTITLVHSLFATLLVRAPLAYLLSRRGCSLFIMGMVAPAASLVSLVICLGYFFWLSRNERKAAHSACL